MSPASYRTAPPRVVITILRGPGPRSQIRCRAAPSRLLAALPGGYVGLVAVGVGERPPRGCVLVADQATAPPARPARRTPRLALVVRHGDVDVEPVAPRLRRVDLLEPERRPAPPRIVEVLIAYGLIAENRPPEGHQPTAVHRVDRDLHRLHGARVRGHAEVAGRGRDLPGKLDVARAQPADLVRHKAHADSRVPQINVGMMISRVGQVADGVDQRDPAPERAGLEVRAGAAEHDSPVINTASLVELSWTDPFGHNQKHTPIHPG